MNRTLAALAFVALSACPPPVPTPDGGDDGGPNPNPIDACSGGCAVNQICDTQARVCRDACGGCDGGICQKNAANGTFACVVPPVTCSGVACEAGQVACIAGGCACLGPARGTFDSCFGDVRFAGDGRVCGSDGLCVGPKRYQQCKVDGEACATEPGGKTLVCNPVFGDYLAVCTRPCTQHTECDRGELCGGEGAGCLPQGLFNGQECAVQVDGGFNDAGMALPKVSQTVGPGSTCLRKNETGTFTETEPSGTCGYSFFYFADQGPYVFFNCRPAGGVVENGACVQDPAITSMATQCSTGLECAAMRGGNDGVCLKTCNALIPSMVNLDPQPHCAGQDAGTEACVNLYRREDLGRDGALMGVCTKTCNVFDTTKSQCPSYGTFASTCVPTNADGRVVVTGDGSGICVPQLPQIATLGSPCTQPDPFKGAACATGQICPPAGTSAAPVCTQVCDTTCTGANPPARCATQVNSTCASGKTCTRVTTTTGSRVGFCL